MKMSFLFRRNKPASEGDLLSAARSGNTGKVQRCLDAGVSVHCESRNGKTPLYRAAEYGHQEVVGVLLGAGAHVDAADKDGRTPLHCAAVLPEPQVAVQLLGAGAAIGAADKRGTTPLHLAATSRREEVVELLLGMGAVVDTRDKQWTTPLHLAAANGHKQLVGRLLIAGASKRATDRDGRTPAQLCKERWGNSMFGDDIVKALDQTGAAPKDGSTGLHWAARDGRIAMVQQLLSAGAAVDATDKDGKTPLSYAAENEHLEVMRQLLGAGAAVDGMSRDGWTPLHHAASMGKLRVMEQLLAAGAAVDATSKGDKTPLHYAASTGRHVVVEQLLAAGAAVNAADEDGWTPLHHAASMGKPRVTEQLLDAGAAVDATSKGGKTPLHLAASKGLVKMVEQLLCAGATVDAAAMDKLRTAGTLSRAQKATGLAASQQGPLCNLPLPLTEDILHKAGPRSRQLCRALELAYGPLPSLSPRGLTRILDLLSALTRQGRHKQLQALDLTRIPHLVTDSSLKLLLKALPNLQRLRLPISPKLTAHGFAAAQPLLRSLTALHIAFPLEPDPLVLLDAIAGMTQLRELTVPSVSSTFEGQLSKLSSCAQLSRLEFSPKANVVRLDAAPLVSCASHLPGLVSLSVNARILDLEVPSTLQELRGLTALTELRLGNFSRCTSGDVMEAIDAMAGLRSLRLRLPYLSVDQPPDGCWPTRLSSLTSLDVCAAGAWAPFARAMLHGVVSAVPHLPALQELRLSSTACYPGAEPLGSDVFAGLASLSGVLEVLELESLKLPGSYMEAVQQLTRLTNLGISHCPGVALSWLTGLTGLRKLSLQPIEHNAVSSDVFKSLKQLHTLKLGGTFVDSPYLTSLCAALPQLRVLHIVSCSSPYLGAGVSALGRLTSLEVLDLSHYASTAVMAGHLRAPQSLRRCVLRAWQPVEDWQAFAQLLGTDVDVVFNG